MADSCASCLQPLHDPRVLSCLHSFCYNCVSYNQRGPSVHCPQCFFVTECEASAVPKDLSLDMIVRSAKGLRSCTNCAATDATCFCSECCASMCEGCSKSIHNNNVLRHHRVRNLYGGKVPTPIDFCPIHRDEVSIFCVPCKRWICRDCLSSGAHRGHETLEQERALDSKLALQDRLVAHGHTLRAIQNTARDAASTIHVAQQELEECRLACANSINTYMDVLQKTVEVRRHTLLKLLQQRGEEKARLLEHQHRSLKSLDFNMERSLEYLRIMSHEDKNNVRYLLQMEAWASHYTNFVAHQRIATVPCVSPSIGVSFPAALDGAIGAVGDLSTPSCPEKSFQFITHGDKQGVFYYLGTSRGCSMYSNPAVQGALRVTASSLGYGAVENVVGIERGDFCSQNLPGSWVDIELPIACTLLPTTYTICHDKFDAEAHFLRNWNLMGLDPITHQWTVIKEHKNDTTLKPECLQGRWELDTRGKRYSGFRILQTGVNSHGNHYLMMSGVEFYGKVFEE